MAIRETRSPFSATTRKSERGPGVSPLGRADAGYGGHILPHVGKNSRTPESLRTSGRIEGQSPGVVPER
jgi:hypothetical protein